MVLRNVLDFLVPILWGLVVLAFFIYIWKAGRQLGLFEALRRLLSKRVLWPLAGLATITVISASLVFIDPREVGVVVSLFKQSDLASDERGGIRKRPLRSGLHFVVPLAEHVVRYPIVVQSYTMSGRPYEGNELGDDAIRARTSDGQLVIIDVTALFRIDPELSVQLHVDWQDRYINDFIRPGLRAFVRSQASKFTVDEVNSHKRKAFEDALNELTRSHCENSGIQPLAVLVRNITFSGEYATSVEDKMTARQRIQEAEFKAKQIANLARGEADKIRISAQANADRIREIAEAEADAHVVKATAEAEALNRIGEALNARDNLLTYRYIDKLSPNIRAMLLPSDSPLILPMPELGAEGQQRPAVEVQPPAAKPPTGTPIKAAATPATAHPQPPRLVRSGALEPAAAASGR